MGEVCLRGELARTCQFLRSAYRTEVLVRRENVLYASEIKETANGSRRRTRGEAWQAFQVVAQRRITAHGEVDE